MTASEPGSFAAALMLVAASVGSATNPAARIFPVADTPVLQDRFPVEPVEFADGVTSFRDVVYQQLPGFTPQIVDVYVPATEGRHPLVLYIHGGGWMAGHTRHSGALADFPSVLAALASEGFTVASVEYRLASEAVFPAQLHDIDAALRFLRANAAQYKIDPARAGVWGGSAGGHLAALTALTCRDTSLDPASANDGCVQAVVSWYGVFDFEAMAAGRPDGTDDAAERLLGCQTLCSARQFAFASPVTYIDAKDPPFLLIHGEEDKVVPIAQSQLAGARLRAAGVPVQELYIPGVDHSFIGRTPAETRDATLRATNSTFDFFHEKLGVPRE